MTKLRYDKVLGITKIMQCEGMCQERESQASKKVRLAAAEEARIRVKREGSAEDRRSQIMQDLYKNLRSQILTQLCELDNVLILQKRKMNPREREEWA